MSENTQENAQNSTERSIGIPGSGLSRMGATMQRSATPGTYPGYMGSPSFTPATGVSPSTVPQFDSGRKLIVGQGISMSGEIESCDHLIVEGKVEAALRGAKLLDITENGTFFGTVEIEEANVAGVFEGDLTVKGRLTVKAGGSITGEISYGELAIEAGAVLDGSLRPLNAVQKDKKGMMRPGAGSVKNYQQQMQKVAQDQVKGGELPFSEEKKVVAAE
ncbi:MAG: polymer-forming cytoskeletal protein [Rhodospirillales bacterium]|nr:polymer-forming cytoskeletal protein [Rhodospirillales bacterium]